MNIQSCSMNQKVIGIALIVVSLIIGAFVYNSYQRSEVQIQLFVEQTGSCYLDDGTCLHDESQPVNILGWAVTGALLLFGVYLTFFDRTQQLLAQHQVAITQALESAKRQDRDKDEFKAYVAGFADDEQKILLAIKEQDGITQSTLRYRTGLSKTGLSLLLSSLEKRDVVSRKSSGKTKEVYLRKKF